jgi:formate dehydrogenase iron-sulfur subunit
MQYLNAFFLLTDRPEAYNLPAAPTRPSNRIAPALTTGLATLGALALAAIALLATLGEEGRHGR